MVRILTIITLALLASPMSIQAQSLQGQPSPFYVAGAVGQSTFWDVEADGGGDVEFDLLAFFISGAVGYRFNPNLRTEAEWLFESADIDDSSNELEVIRVTASGYYDLAQTNLMGLSGIVPYAGGGAGIAFLEDDFDDSNELTFHVEAGLSMPILDRVDFVPGIRFEYTFLDDDDFDDNLWITQLRAGVRYNF